MKKVLLSLLVISSLLSTGIKAVQAESFGSDCSFISSQTSETNLHLELVDTDSQERSTLCTVVSYRVENQGDSTAEITGMTEYSLDISVSEGDQFTVYVEKDGEAVSQYFEYEEEGDEDNEGEDEEGEDEEDEETYCMNTVVDLDGRYSIELLGEEGERVADCRFSEYSYEVLSGEADHIGMNEYTLFFDGSLRGTVQVTVTEPTFYQATFEIGTLYEGVDVPPAGYEEEVVTSFVNFENPFPDTDLTTLEGTAAAELYRRAVIGGYPDGEFKGDQEVNRAEAAKFLLYARYGSIDDIENNGMFDDVLDGEWYTKFVVTAANEGIISGYPDGFFRPASTVNTVEFLKMLTLTFDLEENLPYSYTDVDENEWFVPFVGVAEAYELFPERTTELEPGQNLTRAEVAVAIYQYLLNR